MEDEFEQLAQCMDSVRLTKIPSGMSVQTLIEFNDKIRFDLSGMKQPLCLGEHEYLEPYVTSATIKTDMFDDSEYLYNYSNLEHASIVFSNNKVDYIDDRSLSSFQLAIFNLPKLKNLKLYISGLDPVQVEFIQACIKFPGSDIQVEFPEARRNNMAFSEKG